MQIRLIGLGKMGLNLAINLKDKGHNVIGFAKSKETRDSIKEINVASTLEDLFKNREEEIIVWLMVPHQATGEVIDQIKPFLKNGDIVVDGGNSNFNLSIERYNKLKEDGISFLDAGTSGGISGAREGACLMVGGDRESFLKLEKIFKDISAPNGFIYTGSAGSGHFVKMIHNGIEYGMMQAMGEGFELLEKSGFNLNLKEIAKVWNNGSIIESSLLTNITDAFEKDEKLQNIQGVVDDSGEGLWTVEEALKLKVSIPVIANSLFARFKSKDNLKFSEKVVSALRSEFGGHYVYKK